MFLEFALCFQRIKTINDFVNVFQVNWRPVFWGLILQFVFAILVLRWKYGYVAIKFLADEINKFIQYGFAGAAAVFGDPFLVFHPFAFMVSE